MTTVNIDDLLAARDRLNAERKASQGVGGAEAPPDMDLSLARMVGLWVLLTALILLRVLAMIVTALAGVILWAKAQTAPPPKRRSRRR